MKNKLPASEQHLDSLLEAKFCIQVSREFEQNSKKQKFMSKLNFQYSLSKINKEKIYGRLIGTANMLYPRISYENNRYAAQQYSSPRIRDNRRSFILYKQQPPPQHKQTIKRYTQILNKKKNKGGLESFWMFKREDQTEQKKTRGKSPGGEEGGSQIQIQNKVQKAFGKIFLFAKIAVDIQTGIISKNLFIKYLNSIMGECFTEWFVNFFQVRSYFNFKQFQALGQKFRCMSLRQTHLISFQLYDQNGDGFICPRDVFAIFQRQLDAKIEQDILQIAHFAKLNQGKQQEINDLFKIEHVIIRDQYLTIKDYEMFFKKVDEPFLRATNKKDTGFSKTFAVLDHREKVRSTRRELNQKKMMYNELFGEIARQRKSSAYIDQNDYKLNYTFFHQIFALRPTCLFFYFCKRILGIVPQLQ